MMAEVDGVGVVVGPLDLADFGSVSLSLPSESASKPVLWIAVRVSPLVQSSYNINKTNISCGCIANILCTYI